jgi:hypothetical protein
VVTAASAAATAHWRAFRSVAWSNIEYSFDADPARYSVMIPGDDGFLSPFEQFAAAVPFAGDFAWKVRRFVNRVRPDAFLFRVDWRAGAADSLSLYCRFPVEPDDCEFADALAAAWPNSWSGPAPSAVAEVLGVPGPRGLALRAGSDGREAVSVYFRTDALVGDFPSDAAERLLESVGHPADNAHTLRADLSELCRHGPLGVVGLDPPAADRPGALKFNPPNVPAERAFGFLAAKGARSERLKELAAVARSLRAVWLSYLGVRYGPSGFSGWRMYFSLVPHQLRSPLSPSIVTDRIALPTLRLPHL